jgi:hypothetical protein
MAGESLRNFLKNILTTVINKLNKEADKKIFNYIFTKQYHNGCEIHPDIDGHAEIAKLVTAFIRQKMKWE